VLARLGFRRHDGLLLTTTLQPCLQCATAIRLSRVTAVRFAGHDVAGDGCHEFSRLSTRESRRTGPSREGPRTDEVGVFGLLIARVRLGSPRLVPGFDRELRALGEGPVLDLAYQLEDGGELGRLTSLEVDQALAELWPRLQGLV
jgi:hypothetical protein